MSEKKQASKEATQIKPNIETKPTKSKKTPVSKKNAIKKTTSKVATLSVPQEISSEKNADNPANVTKEDISLDVKVQNTKTKNEDTKAESKKELNENKQVITNNDKTKSNTKDEKKSDKKDEDTENLSLYERFANWVKTKVFKKKQEEVATPNARRIKADPKFGLSLEQVADRTSKGFVNKVSDRITKSYRAIFFGNIFTFFNLLCFAIAIALIITKAPITQLLFMVIILANLIIGIAQEIRAKKTIEKLSLLTAPSAIVLRAGKEATITTDEVVLDDIIILGVGKQIIADCIVLEGNVEVNESLLTGESLPIKKKVGSTLLSGSFVSSGSCKARVVKIGKDSYVEQLTSKAKKYRKPKSELFNSLNAIIKVIGFILVPIVILTIINTYAICNDVDETIQLAAGSAIGMIPAGMFLLSSIALTVSVIRLANQKALVQDLYCVEMLARVNVLCLDKTGTITDGTMKVYNCIELQNKSGYTLKRIMGSFLSSIKDNNQTSQALINYFGYNKELKAIDAIPFSSSRKYSAVSFEETGTFMLGAPEFVLPGLKDNKFQSMVEQYAKDGYRVLVLANATGNIAKNEPPSSTRTPVAILVLEDRIRDDAIETIRWFKENDVKIKIISGDNPLTVSEIAKRVGVEDTESFINLEGMNETQVRNAANKYTVFGRVTPEQKAILVRSIKAQGNCVAMTGDGVNDILALKEADCSVAMASGSDAVRSVSHMVLMDSNFSSMPATVKEGRRVINNVQKSSSLFFMKTIFTIVFSIALLCLQQQYLLKTNNLLMLEWFVIGIPSFFLALQPNTNRVQGRFISNLFKNALPGAITLIINVAAVYIFATLTHSSLEFVDVELLRSMCTIIMTFTGLALLLKICKPFTILTGILYTAMLTITVCCTLLAPELFGIMPYSQIGLANIEFLIILAIASFYLVNFFYKIFDRISLENINQLKRK